MKNKKQQILLFILILVAISGCDAAPLTAVIPNASPANIHQYAHYIPPKEFNIYLEFEYPDNWILKEQIDEIGFVTISFGDPQFLLLPTSTDLHPIPSDLGSVIIFIIPEEYSQTPQSQIDQLKQDYSNTNRITILRDYQIKIDGYIASVLEYQTDDKETSPSTMFNRRTYFTLENKLYEIYFQVAEKDRGKEFEKGYEYLINSLKIAP